MARLRAALTAAPIKSPAMLAYSYDPASRQLVIVFQNERAYAYHNVPAAIVRDFAASDSPARYFNEHLRGTYRFEELDDSALA